MVVDVYLYVNIPYLRSYAFGSWMLIGKSGSGILNTECLVARLRPGPLRELS